MLSKIIIGAVAALFTTTEAAKLAEPDHIAIALAESLSTSAMHLVQLASQL